MKVCVICGCQHFDSTRSCGCGSPWFVDELDLDETEGEEGEE